MLAIVAASVASAEEQFKLGVADEHRQAMVRTKPVLHASVPKLQIPDAKQVPQIHDHQWLTPVAQHKPPAEHKLPFTSTKQAPGACQVLQRHPPPQLQQQPVQAAGLLSIASDTDAREHEQKHKDGTHVSAFIQKNYGDEEALASDSVLMSYSGSDSTATGDFDSRIGVIPQRVPKRRFIRPDCVPRLSIPPPQSQPLPRCNQAPQEQQQQPKTRTQSVTRSKERRQVGALLCSITRWTPASPSMHGV